MNSVWVQQRIAAVFLLGFLVTAVLIWWVGPLLVVANQVPLATASARYWAIAAALLTESVAYFLWWLWGKRETLRWLLEAVHKERAQQRTVLRNAAELESLQQRFADAVRMLRKARFGAGFGSRCVYQLPWYLVLGVGGAGKTRLLTSCGLPLSLAGQPGSAGFNDAAPTRECAWYFTDQAVFLELSGTYVTQEREADLDKDAWAACLKLLQKYRRRRSVNGVLLTINLSDVLSENDAERFLHAYALRSRLQELYQAFGTRVPVYVLFSKCDLLPGFSEFFANLSQAEREQVFGTTLPLQAPEQEPVVPDFAAAFLALTRRLEERYLGRLQEVRDMEQRAAIFGFPVQFQFASRLAQRFLLDVFQATRFEQHILLRGVYWTSAGQGDLPAGQRSGSALASPAALPSLVPAAAAARGFFLSRLLREVIIPEAGLVGCNRLAERRLALARGGLLLACMAGAGLLAAGWYASFQRNAGFVASVEARTALARTQLAALTRPPQELIEALPALHALRDLPGGDADPAGAAAWVWDLGLSQQDRLGAEARAAYQSGLRDLVLPGMLKRLEEQLRTGSEPDYAYDTLRVYLMLFEPQHYDPAAVSAWFERDWERNLPRAAVLQRQQLRLHLQAALPAVAPSMPVQRDDDLVTRVRARLAGSGLADRVYAELQRSPASRNLREFRISEAAGADAPLVLVRRSGATLSSGVPGLFTQAGYRELLQNELPRLHQQFSLDAWVIGPAVAGAAVAGETDLVQQLRKRYFDDYRNHWDALLADLDLAEFHSAEEGAKLLNILSAPDSPLRSLLSAVSRETRFASADPQLPAAGMPADPTRPAAVAVPDRSLNTANALAATAAERSDVGEAQRWEAELTAHFQPLHRMLEGAGGEAAPLDKTLQMFNELATYLNGLASAQKRGEGTAAVPDNQVLDRLHMEAGRQPAPVGVMLRNVAGRTAAINGSQERQRLSSLWNANVDAFCRQGIHGRYPLSRRSQSDATPQDFAQFFGPGGILDDFFQKNLKGLVDTNGPVWRWRGGQPARPSRSAQLLAQFQRGAMIRDGFFANGAQLPSFSFELKPKTLDPRISQLRLDLDGQVATFDHFSSPVTVWHWPGPGGAKTVRLQIIPPGANGTYGLLEQGPWALFRLLDRARVTPGERPERFEVSFDINGLLASFELTAASVKNPLQWSAANEFQCPMRL